MDPQGGRCDKHIDLLRLSLPPHLLLTAPCTQHMPHFIHPARLHVSLKVPPPSLLPSNHFTSILSLYSFFCPYLLPAYYQQSLNDFLFKIPLALCFLLPSFSTFLDCLSVPLFSSFIFFFFTLLTCWDIKVSNSMGKNRKASGTTIVGAMSFCAWESANLLWFSPYQKHQ